MTYRAARPRTDAATATTVRVRFGVEFERLVLRIGLARSHGTCRGARLGDASALCHPPKDSGAARFHGRHRPVPRGGLAKAIGARPIRIPAPRATGPAVLADLALSPR